MPEPWWWILALGAALAGIAILLWRPARMAAREARLAQAKRHFHRQRERLEAKFIQLAAAGAKPDAPRWTDCDFDDAVAYVRNRATGELSAFVAVTVALDGLPDVSTSSASDLIGNLRAGTAVFRFDRDHWETDGRAILNLSPSEAIRFYQNDLEVVGQELAEQS
jgi:hypothetical protein